MRSFVRPDGRRFVREPDAESLAALAGDVYRSVDEGAAAACLALGFTVHRREGEYVLPTDVPEVAPPAGIRFARADEDLLARTSRSSASSASHANGAGRASRGRR